MRCKVYEVGALLHDGVWCRFFDEFMAGVGAALDDNIALLEGWSILGELKRYCYLCSRSSVRIQRSWPDFPASTLSLSSYSSWIHGNLKQMDP